MSSFVVAHTSRPYSEEDADLLRRLAMRGIDLFAAVGVGCEAWEEAMDWVCIDLSVSGLKPGAFCNTTSHPNESLEEVMAFANQWRALRNIPGVVELIKI